LVQTIVRGNRLLASLPPDELASLQPHLRKVELRRGTVLHQPRAPIERVYFPASGMVSLLMVMRSGEAIETAVIGREGAVGASVANNAAESYGQAIMQIAGLAAEMSGTAFERKSSPTPAPEPGTEGRQSDCKVDLSAQRSGANRR
jgi:CRP-like cAMP-binding protein